MNKPSYTHYKSELMKINSFGPMHLSDYAVYQFLVDLAFFGHHKKFPCKRNENGEPVFNYREYGVIANLWNLNSQLFNKAVTRLVQMGLIEIVDQGEKLTTYTLKKNAFTAYKKYRIEFEKQISSNRNDL